VRCYIKDKAIDLTAYGGYRACNKGPWEKNRLAAQRTSIYRGKVIDLDIETALLPNGRSISLEIVHHPGGAAIVAMDERRRLCLLRQYRHAAGGWIWELPAGKREQGEDPLHTAQRELEEEAGVRAASWKKLGTTLTTPGFCDEVIHLYLAQGLTAAAQRIEEHELLECHWIACAQALDWVQDGTLTDAKSIIGLHLARVALKTSHQSKC
jgi:ADP-ribose diphosphatase